MVSTGWLVFRASVTSESWRWNTDLMDVSHCSITELAILLASSEPLNHHYFLYCKGWTLYNDLEKKNLLVPQNSIRWSRGQGKNYSHSFSDLKKRSSSHFLCVTPREQKDNFHAWQRARWGLLSELWVYRKSPRITRKPRYTLGQLEGGPAHLCFKACH